MYQTILKKQQQTNKWKTKMATIDIVVNLGHRVTYASLVQTYIHTYVRTLTCTHHLSNYYFPRHIGHI